VTGWVDSHCHLQSTTAPVADVLSRATNAGVDWMVCVGTDLATSVAAVDLARAQGPRVLATVGLHPHDAVRFDDEWDAIAALAHDDRVCAVGEAGFDLHYRHSPDDAQARAFRAHVQLAHSTGKALVIHTREAWAETFAVLDDEGMPARTVFHCFTGGEAEARACVELGAYISFSGIVSFKRADDVRAAAAVVPDDRVLVETDAPFLAPVPHRGSENEPALVPLVGTALAAARAQSVDDVMHMTHRNALTVFGREPSA